MPDEHVAAILMRDAVQTIAGVSDGVSLISKAGKPVSVDQDGKTDLLYTHIGPSAPANPPNRYLWIQTGLGDGTDFTMWFEDGLP